MTHTRISLRRPANGPLASQRLTGQAHSRWDWEDGIRSVWRVRRQILLAMLFVAFAAGMINAFRPDVYTARAVLLPPRTQGKMTSLASLAPSILSMAGAALPSELGGGSDLYPTILKSESVIRPMLTRSFPIRSDSDARGVTLLEIVKTDDPQIAVERVRDLIRTRVDRPTGACHVAITLKNPVTAAAICNALVNALTERRIALHASGAAQVKDFIAGRLEQVRLELVAAESELEEFRARNRNYNTGGSPGLKIEDDRLARQVMMKSQLYVQLSQEYEMARIEETRDVADIQILDTAAVPTRPSGPHRVRTTLAAGFAVGPAAIATLLLLNFLAATWGLRLPEVSLPLPRWMNRDLRPISKDRESDDRL